MMFAEANGSSHIPARGARRREAMRRSDAMTVREKIMKRTAGAMTMLAALSGCMTQGSLAPSAGQFNGVGVAREAPGLVGPWGQPVATQANGTTAPVSGQVTPVVRGVPGDDAPVIRQSSYSSNVTSATANATTKDHHKNGQIPPAPPAGPPGAVAAVPGPALPGGFPMMGTARTSIRFLGQDGMRVAWYAPLPDGHPGFRDQLETPGRYNFLQGGIYRLRLSNIPRRGSLFLYPTLEVAVQNPKTTTFLAHSAVPVSFTDDDVEQAIAGNFVVKVIYLPDPQFQDLATAGPDEVVSTKLEPGIDPLQEAQRRGSVLAIIRLGNIDLEAPNTPGMDAPNPFLRGPAMPPPPAMPAPKGPAGK